MDALLCGAVSALASEDLIHQSCHQGVSELDQQILKSNDHCTRMTTWAHEIILAMDEQVSKSVASTRAWLQRATAYFMQDQQHKRQRSQSEPADEFMIEMPVRSSEPCASDDLASPILDEVITEQSFMSRIHPTIEHASDPVAGHPIFAPVISGVDEIPGSRIDNQLLSARSESPSHDRSSEQSTIPEPSITSELDPIETVMIAPFDLSNYNDKDTSVEYLSNSGFEPHYHTIKIPSAQRVT